jgi:hypothetical protein
MTITRSINMKWIKLVFIIIENADHMQVKSVSLYFLLKCCHE